MAAAWELGWIYHRAGQAGTYVVSWNDTWQGVQFIVPEARGNDALVSITAYGIRSIPRFGQPPRISYYVDVVNAGPSDTNFVLRGGRVAD